MVLSVCFIRGNEVRSVHLSFSFEVIEYFGNQAYDGRSSDQIEECMIMIVAICIIVYSLGGRTKS